MDQRLTMKVIFSTCIILLSVNLQAQIKTPAMSPSSTIKQHVGITDITINYFRPSVRGRQIFGKESLLLNGDFWRTGANGATKFTFSNDVFINGKKLIKGEYSIISIIGEKEWIINWYPYKENNWAAYVDKTPILTSKIAVGKSDNFVETLEMRFQNITLNSAMLLIEWENISLKIPIELKEEKIIMQSIENTLSGPNSFDYFQAALYMHEANQDLNTALKYIKKVTDSDDALFFQVTREALILQDLGKEKEAAIVAKRGLSLSQKAGNIDFVRMNKQIISNAQN